MEFFQIFMQIRIRDPAYFGTVLYICTYSIGTGTGNRVGRYLMRTSFTEPICR